MDNGGNAGIRGIVDIAGAPQFTAKVMKFTISDQVASIDTTGQGSSGQGSSRAGDENGGLILSAQVQRVGFPVPTSLRFAIGTIKIQYDTSIYATETVRVESYKIDYDESNNTIWKLLLVCTRVSATVWTGWKGTQATPTPPEAATSYLYAGRQKIVDANTLVDSSVMTIDVTGVTDSDAGEITRLAAVLTTYATPPQSGEKLYTAAITRTDAGGMRVAITWKPNNSVDDIVLPATMTVTDPKNLTDRATMAAVDSTALAPTGLIARAVTAQPKTPAHTLYVTEAGLRTTQEDLEFPETHTNTDPQDLTTNGQQLSVFTTAAPPSDPTPPTHTKIVDSWVIQLTSQGTPKSYKIWRFEPQTSKDKIEQGETVTNIDALGLQSSAKATKVDATPTAPTGTVARITSSRNLSDWHTATSIDCGVRTTKEDVEFPGTFTDVDPLGITTNGRQTIIFATGTPPTATPPTGTKITGQANYNLTSAGTPQSYSVVTFNARSSQDNIEFPKTMISVDPASIRSTATVAAVSAASYPAVPSPLVAVATEYEKVVDGKICTITRYGTQTSTQEIINRGTSSERSAIQPWNDVVCAVVLSTATAKALADSQWATYQNATNLLKLTVEKIDPYTARIIYFYYNPGILVEGYTLGVGRKVRARVNAGVPQVYVSTNKSRGSGTRLIQLSEQWITSIAIRRFIIRRLLTGTVIPEYVGILGNTNNATFLGLASGTCVYEGPMYSTNLSLSGTLSFFMGYQMSSDTNGFFDGPPDDFYKRPQTLTTTSTATGWVNASALGLSSFISFPTTGDFSPIVS